MAGFQPSTNGRFWVSTEVQIPGIAVPLHRNTHDSIYKAFIGQAIKEARETGSTVDEVLDRWDNTPVSGPFELLSPEELIESVRSYYAGEPD